MKPKDFDEDYEENIESADSSYIEDVKENDIHSDPSVGNIIGFINDRFTKAEDARRVDEDRWMQAYRNYRGLYSPCLLYTSDAADE